MSSSQHQRLQCHQSFCFWFHCTFWFKSLSEHVVMIVMNSLLRSGTNLPMPLCVHVKVHRGQIVNKVANLNRRVVHAAAPKLLSKSMASLPFGRLAPNIKSKRHVYGRFQLEGLHGFATFKKGCIFLLIPWSLQVGLRVGFRSCRVLSSPLLLRSSH